VEGEGAGRRGGGRSGGVDAGVKEDPAANRSKSNAPGEESEKKEGEIAEQGSGTNC